MQKDKNVSHALILKNAKDEFLELGFEKASMRSIAKKSGVTAGALYKHFKSKEEMFNDIVEPAYKKLIKLFDKYTDYVMNDLEESPDEIFEDSVNSSTSTISLIYEYFDEFQLMFNQSVGTRFEHIRENIVEIESKSTKQFLEAAKKNGFSPTPISDTEIHIFATMSLTPLFEVITHGYPYEEAVEIIELMSKAQNYAWEKMVDLKVN